jgi:hypothetical protein
MPVNILSIKLAFPKQVYILAPGYNGCKKYGKIPADCFVIAVNKGIMIPRVRKHIWLAEDVGLVEQEWFIERAGRLMREMNYLYEPYATPVFDDGELYHHFPGVQYVYTSGKMLGKSPKWRITKTVLRGGLTIACKAMQLAIQKGSRDIIFCGVDMQGRRYFDDTETESGHIRDEETQHRRASKCGASARRRWMCQLLLNDKRQLFLTFFAKPLDKRQFLCFNVGSTFSSFRRNVRFSIARHHPTRQV